MTSDYGAPSQLEKIDMLDYADLIVVNKFEKKGSDDAIRDIRKQVQRNRNVFDRLPDDMPVFDKAVGPLLRMLSGYYPTWDAELVELDRRARAASQTDEVT